jgi:hypothetical protein
MSIDVLPLMPQARRITGRPAKMEVAMFKAAHAMHLRVMAFAGLVAVAAASAQGLIAQPLALVAVLGVLGAVLGSAAGTRSQEPAPVPVKADTRVPPSRRRS